MPFSEVKIGMKGHALTVFQGTEIEEFPVEVVAIFPNFIPKKNIFLIRLGGKAEFTGVVAGMSGSPVYLEGRLAGAIAYLFMIFGKEPIAGVTPIEEMLEARVSEQYRDQEEYPVPMLDPDFYRAILNRDYQFYQDRIAKTIRAEEVLPETPFKPIPTLLTVTGAGAQTLRLLKEFFPASRFQVASGGTSSNWEGAPLVPGAPLAAVLMDGDLGVAATGTVTYTENNEVFGFGHPFLESGTSRIPLAQSTIIYTMSSEMDSFKIAAPGKVVGTLRQDRFPSVYGTIGDIPPMVPVKVSITIPRGETHNFNYRVAEDYRIYGLSSNLGAIALISSAESARQSFSDDSVSADITLRIKDHGNIVLSDFYGGSPYSSPGFDSVLSPLAFDLFGLLLAIYGNGFEFVHLEGIDIALNFQSGRRVAEIENIYTPRIEAHPGDSIPLFVKIRPFMQPTKTLKFNIKIPESVPEGSLRILVGDASAATRDSFWMTGYRYPRNLTDVLSDLRESLARRRDHLYVRFTRATWGVALNRKTLPDLPPSISSLVRFYDSTHPISQVLLEESNIPLGYEIIGARSFYIQIKKEV